MSILYRQVVEDYINGLGKKTRRVYKSYLRAIYRALEGRNPKNDDELFIYHWTKPDQKEIEDALQQIEYGSIGSAVSVWKNIIRRLRSKGLMTQHELDQHMSDKRLGDGSHWTTQNVPLNSLLPPEPTTQPNTDTSRHAHADERGSIDSIMRFAQDSQIRTGSTRKELEVSGPLRGQIQFTRPDEVRLDNQGTINHFTKGQDSSMFLRVIKAWLTGAPQGSSARFAKSIATSTKAIRAWWDKYSS